MTPSRIGHIIFGALSAWGLDESVSLRMEDYCCFLELDHKVFIKITFEEQVFGNIWRITTNEGKERIHPSVGAMLKSLSLTLCPTRQVGRVIFVR